MTRGRVRARLISPLLANVYPLLTCSISGPNAGRRRVGHRRHDRGGVLYADDVVVGFEHESDARRFWDAMRERLQEFSAGRYIRRRPA